MIPDHPDALKHLYATPIELLGLQEETIRYLKWNGITSAGHCARFYYQEAHQIQSMPPRLTCAMYAEVAPTLQARGDWYAILDAEVWDSLAYSPSDTLNRRMVLWQGEERDLNRVPIAELGLSKEALRLARKNHIRTVGRWLRNTYQNFRFMFPEGHIDVARVAERFPMPDRRLFQEVVDRLTALGYWALIEEDFNSDAVLPDEFAAPRVIHGFRQLFHLFDHPIDHAGFSNPKALKQAGIISLGHYLRFYRWARRQDPDTLSVVLRKGYDEGERVLRQEYCWKFISRTGEEPFDRWEARQRQAARQARKEAIRSFLQRIWTRLTGKFSIS